jgi:hypothetical protein
MANDYEGSIAQNKIKYTVAVTNEVVVGDLFQSVVIFVKTADASANFVDAPSVGEYQLATASNFADVVKGDLLVWLTDFYSNNAISKVYLVVFDGTTLNTGLAASLALYRTFGFFKLLFSETPADQVTFATVMATDTEFSQAWIGTNDATCLNKSSTTSLAYLLAHANLKPHLEYYAGDHNSAMVQLGISLATLNLSGFAVGNSLDYKAVSTIGGSGTDGANLSATDAAALEDQNVGYWATIGNNTGQVAQFGGRLLDGSLAGADWWVKFFSYVCSVQGATYLTQPGVNHYRNDETYQALLAIMAGVVQPFVQMGKIGDFKITAPKFSKLANTGDSFIVPNAWSAAYNDNVREVTIQGNLTVVV